MGGFGIFWGQITAFLELNVYNWKLYGDDFPFSFGSSLAHLEPDLELFERNQNKGNHLNKISKMMGTLDQDQLYKFSYR